MNQFRALQTDSMLHEGNVIIWWMVITPPLPALDIARWSGWLDNTENARAERFYRQETRETFIAAHALTRRLLAEYTGQTQLNLPFSFGRFGKPEISPESEWRFSLSHTGGLVACALARGAEPGLDVETLARRSDVVKLAETFFTPIETSRLREVSESKRRAYFYRLWTLKEATLKATGKGLHAKLNEFSIEPGSPPTIQFGPDSTDDPADWHLEQWQPTRKHIMALALRRPSVRPTTTILRRLQASDL
ncbi:MAG: 4'-phosphopantetheinyl transferase superfamily protein [Rhodospirillaceae bacterium]